MRCNRMNTKLQDLHKENVWSQGVPAMIETWRRNLFSVRSVYHLRYTNFSY